MTARHVSAFTPPLPYPPSLQLPSDPKMLVTRVQHDRLAHFSLTTLEKEPRRDLVSV